MIGHFDYQIISDHELLSVEDIDILSISITG